MSILTLFVLGNELLSFLPGLMDDCKLSMWLLAPDWNPLWPAEENWNEFEELVWNELDLLGEKFLWLLLVLFWSPCWVDDDCKLFCLDKIPCWGELDGDVE